MKKSLIYKVIIGCILSITYMPLQAQQKVIPRVPDAESRETNKRIETYLELKHLGYTDPEIFEDLGNVSFLSQNYETALFWYQKLMNTSPESALPSGFHKRLQYARTMADNTYMSVANDLDQRDWVAMIRENYQTDSERSKITHATAQEKYRPLPLPGLHEERTAELVHYKRGATADLNALPNNKGIYEAPVALTADGNTAYYSKGVYEKPLYGIFSKKELVHKIYKAQKVAGEWKTVSVLQVCPKDFSAMHPTISEDGSQLFFASNMPGTYGEYDIYVVTIHDDGTHSKAINLGQKVNTKKNDLYPNIVGGNTLFFASEGRNGLGGLDVYMTRINDNNVEMAVHLGSPINSAENDYSIVLRTERGMGYVMSNRGADKDTIQQVAFSYAGNQPQGTGELRDLHLLDVLHSGSKVDYSSSVFEDQ
ncbi:cell envelope biogenesis protein OmpA [Arenibacter sp. GZD96]|uniref:hypothetical protein n=1 Tax=Aurantibrevibacter litoralis TaxID=3106030 RepID=UPI002B001BF1|nr:hypothetical protein [Arenibacter sp. GZD-96]MEA1785823.1 cell envelope biogenesis protein OmpA [Arenibacter sp. GZD-96]